MESSSPSTSQAGTRERILDVALRVLGARPDAGMGEIAAAAGVVRRTVYGHFPTRLELVQTIAQQAADELDASLLGITATRARPDEAWADYIAHLWPLAHRYRILIALRRSEYGEDIHARLAPVEERLSALVQAGQTAGAFGRHLPADALARLAHFIVFTLADSGDDAPTDGRPAMITSLLCLGVPADRARRLADERVGRPRGAGPAI